MAKWEVTPPGGEPPVTVEAANLDAAIALVKARGTAAPAAEAGMPETGPMPAQPATMSFRDMLSASPAELPQVGASLLAQAKDALARARQYDIRNAIATPAGLLGPDFQQRVAQNLPRPPWQTLSDYTPEDVAATRKTAGDIARTVPMALGPAGGVAGTIAQSALAGGGELAAQKLEGAPTSYGKAAVAAAIPPVTQAAVHAGMGLYRMGERMIPSMFRGAQQEAVEGAQKVAAGIAAAQPTTRQTIQQGLENELGVISAPTAAQTAGAGFQAARAAGARGEALLMPRTAALAADLRQAIGDRPMKTLEPVGDVVERLIGESAAQTAARAAAAAQAAAAQRAAVAAPLAAAAAPAAPPTLSGAVSTSEARSAGEAFLARLRGETAGAAGAATAAPAAPAAAPRPTPGIILPGGQASLQDVLQLRENLSATIQAPGANKAAVERLKAVRGAIMNDLEAAANAGGPGAANAIKALKLWKGDLATEQIRGIYDKVFGPDPSATGAAAAPETAEALAKRFTQFATEVQKATPELTRLVGTNGLQGIRTWIEDTSGQIKTDVGVQMLHKILDSPAVTQGGSVLTGTDQPQMTMKRFATAINQNRKQLTELLGPRSMQLIESYTQRFKNLAPVSGYSAENMRRFIGAGTTGAIAGGAALLGGHMGPVGAGATAAVVGGLVELGMDAVAAGKANPEVVRFINTLAQYQQGKLMRPPTPEEQP